MTDYEKYQLQWMIDHNHSLYELIERIGEIAADEMSLEGSILYDRIIDEAFAIFETEQGFQGGEIWPSRKDYKGE